MRDIIKITAVLVVICMVNGLALGLVYQASRGAIEAAAGQTLSSSLKLVLPEAVRFSEKKERSLPGGGAIGYYEGFSADGDIVGYALSARKQGYQSLLKSLVGINKNGVIQGVKVLQQAETPGLGARVDEVKTGETLWGLMAGLFKRKRAPRQNARPWFTRQYVGLSAGELTLLKSGRPGRGIHAISGATITSRALTQSIKESVENFMRSSEGSRQ